MRKIVTLGLLALLFGFLSNVGLASNSDACDVLKDPEHVNYAPTMYGLCVAWHNANEDNKDKLFDKFQERAGFPVPGSAGCPCWGATELQTTCSLDYHGGTYNIAGNFGVAQFTDALVTFNQIPSLGCTYVDNYDNGDGITDTKFSPTTPSEAVICLADIVALVDDLYCGG